ncbi:hypothetical protein [Pseudomonas zeae]|uniref:hypothetical protein n=1 Tax=Pseudomonas zeae TaxID=2745510 RepID=UPI0039E03808
MESIAKLIAIIGLGYLLMTCSATYSTSSTKIRFTDKSPLMEQRPSVRFTQMKRVGRAVNAAGQPTVYILLGSADGGLLDIYLVRSATKRGNVVQGHDLDPTQVELRAQWKGLRFSQAESFPTTVKVSIRSLTSTETVIEVAATLVNSITGTYLEVEPFRITLRKQYVEELRAES